jgi:hypothetical protein
MTGRFHARRSRRGFAAIRGLAACLALCTVACSRTPTASPPVVDIRETTPAFLLCTGRSCNFTGRIQNVGNGCATVVHGTMTFTDAGQSGSFDWALPADQVMRPLDEAEIRVTDIPNGIAHGLRRMTPSWQDTPCQVAANSLHARLPFELR